MKLTFKGFLNGYCRELSGLDTGSLKKLCQAVASKAPRTAEPLFLFALEQGKLEYLLTLSVGTWMDEDYKSLAAMAAPFGSDAARFLKETDAPPRYKKVLCAYEAKRDAIDTDRRIVALMREKILASLNQAGITRYQLCKDLGLNMGNVYAYLDKGDTTKVSRSTARRIMEHAQSYV